jgi:hypothetical protein
MSTPKNLIDRQLDQYCDKDSLSNLSISHFSFHFVLSVISLSFILSKELRYRDKDNKVCNRYKFKKIYKNTNKKKLKYNNKVQEKNKTLKL